MTRVGTPHQSLLLRASKAYAKRQYGRAPAPMDAYAHSTKTFLAYATFEMFLERTHAVDRTLKTMAELRAATLAECEYCLDIGSAVARRSGLSDEQLRDLHRYADSPHFSELEKLVLDYATAVSRVPVRVADDLVARLREHFDDQALVELTSAIAWESYRARMNAALDLAPDGFSEGAACALPASAAADAQVAV